MRTRIRQPYWLLWIALLALFTAGCVTAGDVEEMSSEVPLEGAASGAIEVSMESGTLVIQGGASAFVEGDFTYNSNLQPDISTSRSGDEVTMEIDQGDAGLFTIGESENEWLLRLNDDIPVHLAIDLGSADVDFQLDGVNLASLELDTDSGDAEIDFTEADITQDVDVDGYSVSGYFLVRVPGDVGVQLRATNPGTPLAMGGFDIKSYGAPDYRIAYGQPVIALDLETRSGGISVRRVEAAGGG